MLCAWTGRDKARAALLLQQESGPDGVHQLLPWLKQNKACTKLVPLFDHAALEIVIVGDSVTTTRRLVPYNMLGSYCVSVYTYVQAAGLRTQASNLEIVEPGASHENDLRTIFSAQH